MMGKKNIYSHKHLCRWGILAIAVCFIMIFPLYGLYPFKNKYLPLMIMLIVSPFVALFGGYKPDKNLPILVVILALMFISGKIFHIGSFRISSFIYTAAFFVFFLSFDVVTQKTAIPLQTFRGFLRFLILAYAIVLLIQQLEVLVGIDVPINLTHFGGRDENAFKLNSLAIEPSNLGMILPCVMFCYMKVEEIIRRETKYNPRHICKEDRTLWISFLYAMLGCGAITSFFSIVVLTLYFVNKRNAKYIPIIAATFTLAVVLVMKISPNINERIRSLSTIDYTDAKQIVNVDASSSVRIVPYIIYFHSLGMDSDTFFGHGMDALETLSNTVILTDERIANGDRVGANSLVNTFFDYGFICGLLFLFFILRNTTPKLLSYETLFYFLIYMILSMNHFVLWGFIFSMMTVKKYQTIYKIR